MIRSIRDKGLRRFFETGDRSKLSIVNVGRLETMLQVLDDAERPEDMNIPGWRFHALKGEMKGRYAISVSGNWRLTFAWDRHAIEVDLEDYH